MGAKYLKMVKWKLHATKQRSPDEIRVWQHVWRYMEKNEETTIEEKVKQKINEGLRSTYLKLLCFDYHLMEACLWGFYGCWIFELQWGPLMVIFHHGDAAEDKGEEERGGAIH